MVPSTTGLLDEDFEIEEETSRTYKLDHNREKVRGYTDGLEAVKQAAFKILNTERYRYPIYSWNYGVELEGLFGRPVSYVKSELKRVIREALLQDDRIDKVDGFVFEEQGKRLSVTFQVHSRQGILEIKKEVMT